MTLAEELEVLTAARDYLSDKENHWTQHTMIKGDKVCAVGSVVLITHDVNFTTPLAQACLNRLNAAAETLFNIHVVYVNDNMGYQAMMVCYDLAIAILKNEITDMDIGKKVKTGETEKPQRMPSFDPVQTPVKAPEKERELVGAPGKK